MPELQKRKIKSIKNFTYNYQITEREFAIIKKELKYLRQYDNDTFEILIKHLRKLKSYLINIKDNDNIEYQNSLIEEFKYSKMKYIHEVYTNNSCELGIISTVEYFRKMDLSTVENIKDITNIIIQNINKILNIKI